MSTNCNLYFDIYPSSKYWHEIETFFRKLNFVPAGIYFRELTFHTITTLKPPNYQIIMGPLVLKYFNTDGLCWNKQAGETPIEYLDKVIAKSRISADFSELYQRYASGNCESTF